MKVECVYICRLPIKDHFNQNRWTRKPHVFIQKNSFLQFLEGTKPNSVWVALQFMSQKLQFTFFTKRFLAQDETSETTVHIYLSLNLHFWVPVVQYLIYLWTCISGSLLYNIYFIFKLTFLGPCCTISILSLNLHFWVPVVQYLFYL